MAVTRAFAQSTTDQFIQLINTPFSLEFQDIQTAIGSIAYINTTTAFPQDQTEVVFNELGTYEITGFAHLIRLDSTTDLQFYFWWEEDPTGGGSSYSVISNSNTQETLGGLDDNEVHPVRISPLSLVVSNIGHRLRIRMQGTLLKNAGIVFVDNTKADPNFPGLSPSFSFSALKVA